MSTPDTENLTPIEEALVRGCQTGAGLGIGSLAGPDLLDSMPSWSAERAIRASVLRDILTGRWHGIDPHGIRLAGARIEGRLDLSSIVTQVPLILTDCYIPKGIDLAYARFSAITLERCRVESDALTAVFAVGLTTDTLRLTGARVTANSADYSTVMLADARISGSFDASGAAFANAHGVALDCTSTHVGSRMIFTGGFRAQGGGPHGTVTLVNARIEGRLEANAVSISNADGVAIDAQGLRVHGDVVFGGLVNAPGLGNAAAMNVSRAQLGSLHLGTAKIRSRSGPALYGVSVRVDGFLVLDGFAATGEGPAGAVNITDGRSSRLSAQTARIANSSGPALVANRYTTDSDLDLSSSFAAIAGSGRGAVTLIDAHVGGQLNLSNALMWNFEGPALQADGLSVGRDCFMGDGFTALGESEQGAVRMIGADFKGNMRAVGGIVENGLGPALVLTGARVHSDLDVVNTRATGEGDVATLELSRAEVNGQLSLDGAHLTNMSGPALRADSLEVGRDLLLLDGFNASGHDGEQAAVSWVGAKVVGKMDARGATIANACGPALTLDGASIGQDLDLTGDFLAQGAAGHGVLHLVGTTLTGQLAIDPSKIQDLQAQPGGLAVDNLTFAGSPIMPSGTDWLSLLRERTPAYAAQPYRHLASVAQAAGDDSQWRRTLIAQRKDQLLRGGASWFDRHVWGPVTHLTLGYGYEPWRAFVLFLISILLSVAITVASAQYGGLVLVQENANVATACPALQSVATALTISIPLIETFHGAECEVPTATDAGKFLTISSWILQILAWASATLFVAGFTGAVRRA